MKIGELSTTTGVPIETIRYYERAGILPETARTEGNYRIYGDYHVERLSFVRHCRNLDMTLDEIRVLLQFKDAPAENCAQVNALLDEHIGHVTTRINGLRQLEKQLKGLRALCHQTQDTADCAILTELTTAARLRPNDKHGAVGHVQGTHTGGTHSRAKVAS